MEVKWEFRLVTGGPVEVKWEFRLVTGGPVERAGCERLSLGTDGPNYALFVACITKGCSTGVL